MSKTNFLIGMVNKNKFDIMHAEKNTWIELDRVGIIKDKCWIEEQTELIIKSRRNGEAI